MHDNSNNLLDSSSSVTHNSNKVFGGADYKQFFDEAEYDMKNYADQELRSA